MSGPLDLGGAGYLLRPETSAERDHATAAIAAILAGRMEQALRAAQSVALFCQDQQLGGRRAEDVTECLAFLEAASAAARRAAQTPIELPIT